MLELIADQIGPIEAHLKSLGWIGPNDTLEGLEPAGEGNMNRTLRARLAGRTLVLKQSVPYVAKYPDIAAPVDRINVEAAFYRATSKPPALSMRMPQVLGFDPDNRLLALEDLGRAADFTDIYRGPNGAAAPRTDIVAGHITALLSFIGALHGLRLNAREWPEFDNRAMRALNHAHIFDIPLRAPPTASISIDSPLDSATWRAATSATGRCANASRRSVRFISATRHTHRRRHCCTATTTPVRGSGIRGWVL